MDLPGVVDTALDRSIALGYGNVGRSADGVELTSPPTSSPPGR